MTAQTGHTAAAAEMAAGVNADGPEPAHQPPPPAPENGADSKDEDYVGDGDKAPVAFSAVAGDGSHLELFAGSMCAARGEGRAPACCGAPAAVLYGLELGAARRPVTSTTL